MPNNSRPKWLAIVHEWNIFPYKNKFSLIFIIPLFHLLNILSENAQNHDGFHWGFLKDEQIHDLRRIC